MICLSFCTLETLGLDEIYQGFTELKPELIQEGLALLANTPPIVPQRCYEMWSLLQALGLDDIHNFIRFQKVLQEGFESHWYTAHVLVRELHQDLPNDLNKEYKKTIHPSNKGAGVALRGYLVPLITNTLNIYQEPWPRLSVLKYLATEEQLLVVLNLVDSKNLNAVYEEFLNHPAAKDRLLSAMIGKITSQHIFRDLATHPKVLNSLDVLKALLERHPNAQLMMIDWERFVRKIPIQFTELLPFMYHIPYSYFLSYFNRLIKAKAQIDPAHLKFALNSDFKEIRLLAVKLLGVQNPRPSKSSGPSL